MGVVKYPTDWIYRWAWKKPLGPGGDRKDQVCRVLGRGSMNSALVEFRDGFKVVTSRNGLRRKDKSMAKKKPGGNASKAKPEAKPVEGELMPAEQPGGEVAAKLEQILHYRLIDREKPTAWVKVSLIDPHPGNLRTHPEEQREQMWSAFALLGNIDVVRLVRNPHDPERWWNMDGHLRTDMVRGEDDQAEVLALLLDLDEDESWAAVALFDALGRGAEYDTERTTEALARINLSEHEPLVGLMTDVGVDAGVLGEDILAATQAAADQVVDLRTPAAVPDEDDDLEDSDEDPAIMFGGGTSMSRGSVPLKFWKDQGLIKGDKVLDFGCGKDVHDFARFDPFAGHNNVEHLTATWDTVVCNYVLNTQPSDHLIQLIAAMLARMTKRGGHCLIAVRNLKATAEEVTTRLASGPRTGPLGSADQSVLQVDGTCRVTEVLWVEVQTMTDQIPEVVPKLWRVPIYSRFCHTATSMTKLGQRCELRHVDEVGLTVWWIEDSEHKPPDYDGLGRPTDDFIRRHLIGRERQNAFVEAERPEDIGRKFLEDFPGASIGGDSVKAKAIWPNEEEPIYELPWCVLLSQDTRGSFICGPRDQDPSPAGCVLEGYDQPHHACPIGEFMGEAWKLERDQDLPRVDVNGVMMRVVTPSAVVHDVNEDYHLAVHGSDRKPWPVSDLPRTWVI